MKNLYMYALDWKALLSNAESQWSEFLAALKDRTPRDQRVDQLIGDLGKDYQIPPARGGLP